ncbi:MULTISPECIES: hypothetical protein [Pseudomonadota]|uniref:hypothetical protein n=1 Tax=Pseudomonadota TaxID=1224 RepID=UPI002608D3AF|nr:MULTISPECIES: hypothetical protein [Pseudomonadota]
MTPADHLAAISRAEREVQAASAAISLANLESEDEAIRAYLAARQHLRDVRARRPT